MHGVATALIGMSVALVAAIVLTPRARRLALATSFFDRPGLHKSHDTPVPYLGGLAIAVSMLIGLGAATAIGFTQRPPIATVVIAAAAIAVLGGLDDKGGLRADVRLLLQASAASAAVLAGTRLTVTGSAAFDVVLTVVWIVAITNALNFMDNMDGLAAGLGAAGGIAIAVVAGAENPAVAVLSAALAGACLGFLFWNRPPARIYMGDAGSLFIGFLLAVLSADAASTLAVPRTLAVPLIVLSVPLLDIVTVMLGRVRRGIPVTIGGRNHLSHRLVARGVRRGHAVLVLVVMSGVTGVIGVGLAKGRINTLSALAVTAVVLAGLTAMTAGVEVFVHDGRPRFPRFVLLALTGAGVVAIALTPSVLAVLDARHDVADAASLTRQAIAARLQGDGPLADAKFSQAAETAATARRKLSGSFVSIGLYVPVVRDNILASREVVGVVDDLAAASRDGTLPPQQLIDSASSRLAYSEERILLRSVDEASVGLRTTLLALSVSTPRRPAAHSSPERGLVLPLALLGAIILLTVGFTLILRNGTAPRRTEVIPAVDSDARHPILFPAAELLVDAEAGQSTS